MNLYLKGKIEDGELVIDNYDLARPYLEEHNGKQVTIRVNQHNNKASNKQMRWYWGVAVETIIKEHKNTTGEVLTKDEVHAYNLTEIVKAKVRTKEILGTTVIYVDAFSLRKMNTKEFGIFKDQLQEFWALKDIDIPDPNENELLNEHDKAYKSLNNIKGENT